MKKNRRYTQTPNQDIQDTAFQILQAGQCRATAAEQKGKVSWSNTWQQTNLERKFIRWLLESKLSNLYQKKNDSQKWVEQQLSYWIYSAIVRSIQWFGEHRERWTISPRLEDFTVLLWSSDPEKYLLKRRRNAIRNDHCDILHCSIWTMSCRTMVENVSRRFSVMCLI